MLYAKPFLNKKVDVFTHLDAGVLRKFQAGIGFTINSLNAFFSSLIGYEESLGTKLAKGNLFQVHSQSIGVHALQQYTFRIIYYMMHK